MFGQVLIRDGHTDRNWSNNQTVDYYKLNLIKLFIILFILFVICTVLLNI